MCGNLGTGSEWQQQPEKYFSKGKLACTRQRNLVCASVQSRREDCGHDLFSLREPHRLIKRVQIKAVYGCQPSATAQSGEYRLHSALTLWAGKWAPMIIVAQTEPPSLANHRKGKTEPILHYLQESGISVKSAGRLNNKQGLFCFYYQFVFYFNVSIFCL